MPDQAELDSIQGAVEGEPVRPPRVVASEAVADAVIAELNAQTRSRIRRRHGRSRDGNRPSIDRSERPAD